MKLNPEQVEIIAHQIARRLDESGLARFSDRDASAQVIARAVAEDLQVEDRLNDEVREILRGISDQMERQNVQYHEMFKLIKNKLARERKLIL